MSEAASPALATAPSRRRSRRRQRGKSRGKVLWITLGAVAVAGTGLFFGARIWLKSYLQSDKFRVWMSGEISQRLNAEVSLESIRWQDSSALVGSFNALGSPESPFAKVEARDIRATINAGGLWDRVWQVDDVAIARVFLDLSNQTPRVPAPAASSSGTGGDGGSSGFFASFLPNRTVVKGINVEQVALSWKGAGHSVEARGIGMHVKPSERNELFLASGRGGTLDLDVLPKSQVKLVNFEASLQGSEITLEQLNAEAAGADISAEGTVLTGDTPSLDLKGNFEGLDLARCIPDDWLKRLKGKAGGEVRLKGDPRNFDRMNWSGKIMVREGMLEGLPLLHVIAKKTRNEAFIRLLLKEAGTDFVRTPDGGWLLDRIVVDAPGLLRLKGTASAAADRTLNGELLLGIVPGTLRYLAGAEQSVFLPLDQLVVTDRERKQLGAGDAGLLWTRLQLRGTLDNPKEDLADRLAKAWFNATVDEVMNMSMEGAIKAAETASKMAGEAAGTVLEKAPGVLEDGMKTGTDLLQKGVQGSGDLLQKGMNGGLKAVEGLIPR